MKKVKLACFAFAASLVFTQAIASAGFYNYSYSSSSSQSSSNVQVNVSQNQQSTTGNSTTDRNRNNQNSNSTAQTNQSTNRTYVALGDSIAAGAGLAPSSDSGGRCARSSQAYPYIVSQSLNLELKHLACGGATAGDLVTQQRVSGDNPGAQLDAAFAGGTPGLITITAGANDMQWLTFIHKCATAECGTDTDKQATKALRLAMEAKLQFALNQIQSRSNGQPPRVVVTGYYNPISNYCKNRQHYVGNNEINWLNKERDALNKSIRNSMKGFKFVKYASTNFTNHSVCSPDPWVQGLDDPAPLHPNAAGQDAIAKSVIKAAD